VLPILLFAALLPSDPDMLKPGDHTRSIDVEKRTRTYLVHVPKSYDGTKAVPVVLIYHGGASDAALMVRFCGLNDKANKEGFIAVYPNGTGRQEKVLTWNGGDCCGYAMEKGVDDVAFTRELLDDLAKVAKVDAKRVYATGMSNGGIMCYRLASELSDRIAAIAPVSGTMGTDKCHPKRPVPVIHFHGTDDEFVPYKGGKGEKSLSQTEFNSVDFSIKCWIKANGCPEEPKEDKFPDKAKDGTTAIRKTYGPGTNDAEVVLITIEGCGAHLAGP
jgi:polyhydroxybutyrate depolymerase